MKNIDRSNFEIVKTHGEYAVRNKMTKNFVIPWGLKTREDAEKAISRISEVIEAIRGDQVEFLTTAQSAEVMGVTASRIRQLVLSGDLRAEKFGRDLMVERREVERFRRRPVGRPKINVDNRKQSGLEL